MTRRGAAAEESAAASTPQPDVTLVERRYDHPDAVELVAALYAEQQRTYGYADPIEAGAGDYAAPGGMFLLVYAAAGHPVGCGGYRPCGPGTVEVKKMYTRPEDRSRGIGRRVLTELERRAVARGAWKIILETGIRNLAAVHLYRSMGYTPMQSYVTGRDPGINRAFVKLVDSPQRTVTGSRLPGP